MVDELEVCSLKAADIYQSGRVQWETLLSCIMGIVGYSIFGASVTLVTKSQDISADAA